MVGTIGPVVDGRAQTVTGRGLIVAAFLAGHIVAAVLLAGLLTALGRGLETVWSPGTRLTQALFAACCLVAAARDCRLIWFGCSRISA